MLLLYRTCECQWHEKVDYTSCWTIPLCGTLIVFMLKMLALSSPRGAAHLTDLVKLQNPSFTYDGAACQHL